MDLQSCLFFPSSTLPAPLWASGHLCSACFHEPHELWSLCWPLRPSLFAHWVGSPQLSQIREALAWAWPLEAVPPLGSSSSNDAPVRPPASSQCLTVPPGSFPHQGRATLFLAQRAIGTAKMFKGSIRLTSFKMKSTLVRLGLGAFLQLRCYGKRQGENWC